MTSRFCDNCEHDIDFHRFIKSAKPTACIAVWKEFKDNKFAKEHYCKCQQFKEAENAKSI